MKKLLTILIILSSYSPVFALTLEGKAVTEVRDSVFQDVKPTINPKTYAPYESQEPQGYRADYSDGHYSICTGNKMFAYVNGQLTVVAISDKNMMDFPRKQYRYSYPSGKLISVSYGISPIDGYIFSPNGKLLGIWKDGTYYKDGKPVASAEVTITK